MEDESSNKEMVLLPLSEILSIKWTAERRRKLQMLRGGMALTTLSQKLMELDIRLSRQYLQRMEQDPEVKGISPEIVEALCKIFQVSHAELLCLKSQKIVQLGVDIRN